MSLGKVCFSLQGVARQIPLDRVLEGVRALEELLAGLGTIGPLAGINVLVQELPEVVGHVQHLQVTGQPWEVGG